jgi:hypothetical protein
VQNVESTLKLALEIIHEINLKQVPNPESIRKLEALTGVKPDSMHLDTWVCEAIQEAMRKRKERADAASARA